MLLIESKEQLEAFQETYATKEFGYYIDWQKVAEHYSGIEIRNFLAIKNPAKGWYFSPSWFSKFDCSSGCVWDFSIIKEVTPFKLLTKIQD